MLPVQTAINSSSSVNNKTKMVKNWALAIGINQYEFLQPLKYAKHDAWLMQEFFRNQSGFEQVFFFSDDSPDIGSKPTRPNRANLLRMLQQLFEQPFLETGDNFWFFFSGHGMIHANQDYLMPADGDPNDIENTAISINYLTECLQGCGAGNIILILDACRYQENKNGEGIGRQTQQIALSRGVISILSCSPHEYSYEIDPLEKSIFTHALLEGLGDRGQCATVKRLNQYLSFRVSALVEQYQNARQTPNIIAEPATKLHLIIVPKYATLDDIATLKRDAFQAEVYKNFELAEQLWIRVNAVACDSDMDAIKAIQRISQLRVVGSQPQTNLTSPPRPLLRTSSLSVLIAQEGLKSTPEISEIPTEISTVNLNFDGKGNINTREFTDRASDLNSERGIDYKRLRDLLAAQKWKQADRETVSLMLKVAGREKEGWLNVESINKFPATDLRIIDHLWVKFSNGRFGFSVQKRIWESLGGQPDVDYETWCKFCDRLGWRRNHNWLFYCDLNFTTNAPEGHFPAAGVVNILTAWSGWVVGSFSCLVGFSALVSRLARRCRL
jgi:uncharacterized caspase-like protein